MMNIDHITWRILEDIVSAGGKPYIIGGAVRDHVLGLPNKDIDIEVFGITPDDLLITLEKHGIVNAVGKSFGILKMDFRSIGGIELDISVPRTESKSGKGHKGFIPMPDPYMTLVEASKRRDFTYNAMFYNPFEDTILDNHHGIEDLVRGITRHVDSATFVDDPLRVLRLAQFNARFNFVTAPETVELCKSMVDTFNELPKERVLGEFEKMLTKGKSIWAGMNTLVETGWIRHFPELADLIGVPQEPEWHPEGDAFVHSCQVADEAVRIAEREHLTGDDKLILMYASLLHDLGKATTTEFIDGRIRSRGHDEAGMPLAMGFMQRLGVERSIIERVVPLIGNHLANLVTPTSRYVRRLAVKVSPSTIKMLTLVMEADHSGRGNLPKGMPDGAKALLDKSVEVKVTSGKPEPIIMGRHLIDMGLTAGPSFKEWLTLAYNWQLDGMFSTLEEGIELITPIIKNT